MFTCLKILLLFQLLIIKNGRDKVDIKMDKNIKFVSKIKQNI